MKRIIFVIGSVLVLASMFVAWRLLGSATAFNDDKHYVYIRTGMTYEEVLDMLDKDTVIKSPFFFNRVAGWLDYPQNVKAGKYEIRQHMGLLAIVHMLRNGRQVPVRFTIAKLRTHEGLAGMVGKKFECDSSSFLQFSENNDSLAVFKVDSNTFLSLILPNTYTYFWNTTPSAILHKMDEFSKAWWTPERVNQARAKGLTPIQAYILASIVEEETNAQADKGKIASVYLNRMAAGMKLGADPTVKYAMKDFELKRIYDKYLKTESPYNTYLHPGLPPGPICTPSPQTITAVLEAPQTNYLYFVAKPDLSGYSNFSATYKEHMINADAYRKALDVQMAIRDSLARKK